VLHRVSDSVVKNSFVIQSDSGQDTKHLCETFWVCCNGEAVEDWCPFAVFDDLQKTPFRPRKHKQDNKDTQIEDPSLMLFAALKDLPVSVDPNPIDVNPELQKLWFVPTQSRSVLVEDEIDVVYGVGDDNGEPQEGYNSEWDDSDADLPNNQPQQIRDPSASSSGGGASSSSGATSSNSANRTDGRVRARLVSDFQYPVDVHFLRAMKEGTTHEWTNYELRFLCRKHGLNRRGKKAELLPRLTTHFSQLYKDSPLLND